MLFFISTWAHRNARICSGLSFSPSLAEVYDELPDDLFVRLPQRITGHVRVLPLETEADEMWSFVGRKQNNQWVWTALETQTKQVIAFYVGDHSRRSAERLWQQIPVAYREQAIFEEVIPAARDRLCANSTGHANIIERFKCPLRQRVSRLVRAALSFS